MKKILLWILISIGLSSCTYTTVSDVEIETIDVHVSKSDWQYTNYEQNGLPYANNYFFAVVKVPEISNNVFDKGHVQAYIVYDRNNSQASKHQLPYVRHYEEEIGDYWNYYTETIDCGYGPGWVEFNYRASDFLYEDDVTINPNAMDFSIVITRGY